VLAAQEQPVDVSLGQPDRARIRAPLAGTGDRSSSVVRVCSCVHLSLPRFTRVPGCPRVFTDARDVTIVPHRRDAARAERAA
jgi:hypothetical protein